MNAGLAAGEGLFNFILKATHNDAVRCSGEINWPPKSVTTAAANIVDFTKYFCALKKALQALLQLAWRCIFVQLQMQQSQLSACIPDFLDFLTHVIIQAIQHFR